MNSSHHTDPSQNYIQRYPQPLDALFLPKTVAVIGAKDDVGTVGGTLMANLKASFRGKLFPINPKRKQVMGLLAYPSIASVPEPVDLAVIVTPAATVPSLIAECVEAGVKTTIVISAGFKELGEAGLKLEEEMISLARRGKMPLVGPNCLGVMNPNYGLNATFAKGMALPGNVAFISQSGAMCTAVLDWSFQERIGFSSFVSIGSMADVHWGTLIDYLGQDPQTHSLLLYMETVGDARAFMTAAREIALEKPIIVIKAGRSQAAAKAAASHTGAMAGSDEVFDAALERIGVLRVNSISELFSMASVLARQPRPRGPNLSIITNAGGPAVLATDAAVLNNAQLTSLEEATITKLDAVLPPAWSHSNPIDILGDADVNRYSTTLDIVSNDRNTDGVLVILSPQDMTDPKGTAEGVKKLAEQIDRQKPLLASWMGGNSVKEGVDILNKAGIPSFDYPDEAAKTFATMWCYTQNLQRLYETPALGEVANEGGQKVEKLLRVAQQDRREILTEFESKEILADYGIPVVRTGVAKEPKDAVELANQIGYPIVLKLFSETITHKTDVGGVILNLKNPEEVLNAFSKIKDSVSKLAGASHFQGVTVQRMVKSSGYELILGSTTDPQFGPVILFGMGGQLVEVFKDRALAIPPLNRVLARHLMEKTRIYEALLGVRGRKSVNIEALENILVRFSKLITENPRIKECDINPLLASEEEIIALDCRVVLHEAAIKDSALPRLAIRPYPLNYVETCTLKNGVEVTLRPIRPEDEPNIVKFHHELSETSIRQRFFEFVSLDQRTAHERLLRICFNDYDRNWAMVAEVGNGNIKEMIAAGRLSRIPDTSIAIMTLLIADAYHHLGLGTAMIRHLLKIAKAEKISEVDAYILSENAGMLKICERLGFKMEQQENSIIHARLKL